MAKRVFKVTRKVTAGASTYRKWEEWTEGDLVVGKYKATSIDQYKKPQYSLEVYDVLFKKDKKLADSLIGKTLTLNACGSLEKAMEAVEIGEIIQVIYNGTSTMEKGPFKGKEAHSVDVSVVEEGDGSEAEESVVEDEDEVEEDEVEDDDDFFNEGEEEEEEEELPPPPPKKTVKKAVGKKATRK